MPMQRLLDAKAIEQLMYLILALQEGEGAQDNAIYTGHQQLLTGLADDEGQVEGYVRNLHRRAQHLRLILDPPGDLPLASTCAS